MQWLSNAYSKLQQFSYSNTSDSSSSYLSSFSSSSLLSFACGSENHFIPGHYIEIRIKDAVHRLMRMHTPLGSHEFALPWVAFVFVSLVLWVGLAAVSLARYPSLSPCANNRILGLHCAWGPHHAFACLAVHSIVWASVRASVSQSLWCVWIDNLVA